MNPSPFTTFLLGCLSQMNLELHRIEVEYGIEMNEGMLVNRMSAIIRCANAVIGAATAPSRTEVHNDTH